MVEPSPKKIYGNPARHRISNRRNTASHRLQLFRGTRIQPKICYLRFRYPNPKWQRRKKRPLVLFPFSSGWRRFHQLIQQITLPLDIRRNAIGPTLPNWSFPYQHSLNDKDREVRDSNPIYWPPVLLSISFSLPSATSTPSLVLSAPIDLKRATRFGYSPSFYFWPSCQQINALWQLWLQGWACAPRLTPFHH